MNSRPSRLLIVDDNEMNRDMLARRLVLKGYVVGLAENAKELLERVKQDAVDLVLLDIEMRKSAVLTLCKSFASGTLRRTADHHGHGKSTERRHC